MTKWVYTFGDGAAEGRAEDRNLLGGKGANLAEMSSLGLPVPPGFTITSEVCNWFYANGRSYPEALKEQVETALDQVGRLTGRGFGDPSKLLLVSVRSGSRASMPGMMDTVLNLGLNDATVEALARDSGDARFAYDSYRRFIHMYSDVVMGLDHEVFEEILEEEKARLGHDLDTDLSADEWRDVIALYKSKVEEELGKPFPQDPQEQLWGAIGAVFSSWMNHRAITYRRLHNIPESWGTAVNVQAMVFGNMGNTSATGVAFTRNPSTGEKKLYGEFLVNAQGEDVVAGIRTPQNITEAARIDAGSDKPLKFGTVTPGRRSDHGPAGTGEGEGGEHGQVDAVAGQTPALAGLGVGDAGPHLVLGEGLQRVGRRRPGHGDHSRSRTHAAQRRSAVGREMPRARRKPRSSCVELGGSGPANWR